MLKFFKLWTFIAFQKSAFINPNILDTWTVSQNKVYIALYLVVENNAYTDIEDHINALEV